MDTTHAIDARHAPGTPLRASGAQRLKSRRDGATGEVRGTLWCSVFVQLSDTDPLIVEDVLRDIVVGDVLNPVGRTMLADEVQRVMRAGIARWLTVEAGADRVHAVDEVPGGTRNRVVFDLPTIDGSQCLLGVDTDTDGAASAIEQALQRIAGWCASQSRAALSPEVAALLEHIDLSGAPCLRSGMASLRLGARHSNEVEIDKKKHGRKLR